MPISTKSESECLTPPAGLKLLTKFFHKPASVASGRFVNLKVNDKQKSDDRTTEEQTSDNRH